MKKSKLGGRQAWKLTLAVVAAASVVGALAVSLSAAAPSYMGWSVPVNVGPVVNTTFAETNPAFSPDGLGLYFDSNRPGGSGGRDLWVSQRATVNAPWGAPVNVGSTVNSASDDANVAFSVDGHWMFFASPRPGGFGAIDLYQSYRDDIHNNFGWQAPVNLGAKVNTDANEQGTGGYFDNGGHPQLYFGSNRPGGLGAPDIYRTDLQPDGTWGSPTPVTELNSTSNDNRPNLRPDGLEIFFYSARPGVGGSDIWTATRATTDATWSAPLNLGATVNTSASDAHPYLSADGRALVLDSTRPGGFGDEDLWVTTRAAQLTVTANSQSRLFGQANPPLSHTISGFVGNDTSAVVTGTAACTTTATASSPAGTYPITCSMGTLSAPGYVFATFVAGTLTVSYSRPCLTSTHAGPLTINAGEAICIGAAGAQTGPVTVKPGGSLDVEGGRITGPLTATAATTVRVCGATITGPLTISNSTGPVLVGGGSCEPNTIVGPVRVTDNTGGAEVNGNHVIGPLRVSGNSAPVHAAGNAVIGPVAIQP